MPAPRPALCAPLLFFVAIVGCGGGSGGFGGSGVLEESGSVEQSSDPEWWLSSGALFFRGGDGGRTIEGELSAQSPWRAAYARSNPSDSDGGAHPQNVFRLVRRQDFQSVDQTVAFRIIRTNLSDSPRRDGGNGVFLFQRYLDEDHLYVTGVRVDGLAVIKKKWRGRNFTLASTPVYSNGRPYDRGANPNVLPQGQWITLRTETLDRPGSVLLRLFVNGAPVLEATDDGRGSDGRLLGRGLAGIRSDFMDLELRDYSAAAP